MDSVSIFLFNEQINYNKELYHEPYYPPASKVSTEVANLTERKNLNTPLYGATEYIWFFIDLINKKPFPESYFSQPVFTLFN